MSTIFGSLPNEFLYRTVVVGMPGRGIRKRSLMLQCRALHLAIFASLLLAHSNLLWAQTNTKSDDRDRDVPASVVFARVAPSILVVQCKKKDGESQGSAVVIDNDIIVTNYHVVHLAQAIQVKQGNQSWAATLLAFDQQHDLAILSVPQLGRPKAALRPSSSVKVGERTFAVGAPRGLELSLSDGLVAALRTPKGDLARRDSPTEAGTGYANGQSPAAGPSLIQTTAPVSPGSSGGGLFDSQGRLIGIVTFVANGQNLNFAHPSEWVLELRDSKLAAHATESMQKPTTSHTITSRPPVIVCKMHTTATWGLFSGGTEMLESSSVNAYRQFERFNTQLIQYSDGTKHAGKMDFVLADMDRQNGFVRFPKTISGPRFELFFWTDDEGTFRITSAEGVDYYGQLRIRTISGECNPPQTQPSKPPAIPQLASCKSGTTALCMEEARHNLSAQKRTEALQLFLTACDQEEPMGCEEAAKLCDGMGLTRKARDLRERAELLRSKKP